MEHTKEKLKVEGTTIIQDETGHTIAQVWPDTRVSSAKSIALMKANAEHLVKCWNSHNDLLEALESIDKMCDCVISDIEIRVRRLARNAIAKAKE